MQCVVLLQFTIFCLEELDDSVNTSLFNFHIVFNTYVYMQYIFKNYIKTNHFMTDTIINIHIKYIYSIIQTNKTYVNALTKATISGHH